MGGEDERGESRKDRLFTKRRSRIVPWIDTPLLRSYAAMQLEGKLRNGLDAEPHDPEKGGQSSGRMDDWRCRSSP